LAFRVATEKDISLLEEFIEQAFLDSKYIGLLSEYKETEGISKYFVDPTTLNIRTGIIKTVDDVDIGCALFEVLPSYFGNNYIARIVAVYLKPDFRGKGYMKEILDAFEYWGKLVGCKYYHVGVSRDNVDLVNRDYVKFETMFMKEIK